MNNIKDFTVPHPLRHDDGRGLIGCMDRRLVTPKDPVLGGDTLFQQIRGGRYGFSGLAVAMEVRQPGSFIEHGVDLADFAQAIGIMLEMKGLLATKHGPTCGGIEGALTIHTGVIQNKSDKSYKRAVDFKPDLSENEYEEVVAAHERIFKKELVVGPTKVKSALTTPRAVESGLWTPTEAGSGPTHHVELSDTNHDTVTFVADYRNDHALDRGAAHAAGFGAYYTSFGAFEEILEAAPSEISKTANLETWWAVEAVILGEVATHHILNGDKPYPTEVIGR